MAQPDNRQRPTAKAVAALSSALAVIVLTAGCTSSSQEGSQPTFGSPAAGHSTAQSAVSATGPCSLLSHSRTIRGMAGSLAAIAAGDATSSDRRSVTVAVADMRRIAADAPAGFVGPLTATADAIDELEKAPTPTQASINNLMAAFADLDSMVRSTCHFPLQ